MLHQQNQTQDSENHDQNHLRNPTKNKILDVAINMMTKTHIHTLRLQLRILGLSVKFRIRLISKKIKIQI